MKKDLSRMLTAVAILFAFGANAQIDNLTNLSPEWTRTGARNAATDGTDIMMYNPGGVTHLKPGWHATIGNQSSMRKPKHEFSLPDMGAGPASYSYMQDGNDLLTPNINLSFNKEKWAVFGGFNIVAGGGEANFPEGSVNTEFLSLLFLSGSQGAYTASRDQHLKASSYYMAASVGAAYKINEQISLGFMVRNVTGKNKSQAGFTLTDSPVFYPDAVFAYQSEADASGIGAVFGVDYMPSQKLNLAIRYETKVKLDFKTKEIENNMFASTEGEMNRRDLPAVLGFGAAYTLSEKTKLLFDFNYYFQTQADWDTTFIGTESHSTSKLAGDASTIALAVEYRINPKVLWSLGGSYANFDFKDQAGYFSNMGVYEIAPGNNFAISTGIAYNPVEKIRINFGFTQAMYSKEKIHSMNYAAAGIDTDVTTTNTISIIGIGVDFAF